MLFGSYSNTNVADESGHKFLGLRNLEGATVCVKDDYSTQTGIQGVEDELCSNACCPPGTCDTAPECTSASLTGEKLFDGTSKPLAMHSK